VLARALWQSVRLTGRPLRFLQLKEEVEAQHDEIMTLARVTAGPIRNGRPNLNGRPNP
jgi:hypothetical protein